MREDRNNGSTRFGGTKEETRGDKGFPSQARLGEATLKIQRSLFPAEAHRDWRKQGGSEGEASMGASREAAMEALSMAGRQKETK